MKADAESREVVQNEIRAWARSVGVVGPSSTVISVRVDAEPALTSLLDGVLPCKLEKSAPQSESTGGAERAVRVLKENLACLETDMFDSGFRLNVNSETLPYLVRYVATMHNQHHRVFGGTRAPVQHVTGQDRRLKYLGSSHLLLKSRCLRAPAPRGSVVAGLSLSYLGEAGPHVRVTAGAARV